MAKPEVYPNGHAGSSELLSKQTRNFLYLLILCFWQYMCVNIHRGFYCTVPQKLLDNFGRNPVLQSPGCKCMPHGMA